MDPIHHIKHITPFVQIGGKRYRAAELVNREPRLSIRKKTYPREKRFEITSEMVGIRKGKEFLALEWRHASGWAALQAVSAWKCEPRTNEPLLRSSLKAIRKQVILNRKCSSISAR